MPTKNALRKPMSPIKQIFKDQYILMMLLKEFRDGILICDHQGIVLQVNQSLRHVLQLTQDVTGLPATDVISDDSFKIVLAHVLQTGSSQVEEIVLEKGVK